MKPHSLTTVFQLLRPLRPFRQVFYPIPEIKYHFLVPVSDACVTGLMLPYHTYEPLLSTWYLCWDVESIHGNSSL